MWTSSSMIKMTSAGITSSLLALTSRARTERIAARVEDDILLGVKQTRQGISMTATARTTGKQTKFIFVTGGVVSSLGKGLASASIASLLETRGLKITMQKLDPYLNVDPGT